MTEADYFLHPDSRCEAQAIGAGTRIWAFAHVLPGARIGSHCNVCDGVFIENDVIVGDRVTIKCGVQLWDGIRLEDDVFVGPNATFTNDRFPRSRQYLEHYLETRVEQGASIGANATILPGITIGRFAMIGAGAVVTRDVPAHALVIGNPARVVRYLDTGRQPLPNEAHLAATRPADSRISSPNVSPTLADCQLIEFPTFPDADRGTLTAIEVGRQLPFQPTRIFFLEGTPQSGRRGGHAHLRSDELLVSLRGAVTVRLWDGSATRDYRLEEPREGLYLPPMIWIELYDFTTDALILAIASEHYDPEDYVYDPEAYRVMMTDGPSK